jgi:endo-1,4-beta-mannosidase
MKEFHGTVSQMRVSPWLASEDLLGLGEIQVTIEGVFLHENVKFDAGREQREVYAVKFSGKEKQMVLNATNRKALSKAFGAKVNNWTGKTVFLHAQDGIRKPGTKNETCYGLRIRAEGTPEDRGIELP